MFSLGRIYIGRVKVRELGPLVFDLHNPISSLHFPLNVMGPLCSSWTLRHLLFSYTLLMGVVNGTFGGCSEVAS